MYYYCIITIIKLLSRAVFGFPIIVISFIVNLCYNMGAYVWGKIKYVKTVSSGWLCSQMGRK